MKKKLILDHVIVFALNIKGEIIGQLKARVKEGEAWFTPRMAKKTLKSSFTATHSFKRQNIWKEVSAR